ncbi:MAG TPA: tetratricopeptide repeat protein [Anaerolineales bacterium]|nr:tetratricopeptide repeat protein [Anaerolineales bacterium]
MENAVGTAGQPVNFGTMAHDHEIYMILADTAVELRDAEALRKYSPHLEKLASRDNHRLYLAIARRALGVGYGLAGEYTAAETRLRQALELFTKLGARWQIGRTLFELGELNLKQPQKETKAREYFAQALGSFEEIRAAPNAERTRAALNALE